MSLYQNKYRIESTRLKNWDYSSSGYYFITICIKNRIPCFGKIIDSSLILSELGKIAEGFWQEIPAHFPSVYLDEFIIMPDHVHGIIAIDKLVAADINLDMHNTGNTDNAGCIGNMGDMGNMGRDKALPCLYNDNKNNENYVGKNCIPEYNNFIDDNGNVDKKTDEIIHNTIPKSRFQNQGKGTISAIIGSFKSICTKTINQQQNIYLFGWQAGFYDRIVHSEGELQNVRKYIINNPIKWEKGDYW